MAGSINKVTLLGNVGGQPEIRNTQITGEELAFFSLATTEKWKDKNTGEQKEKTDWHRIVIFSPGLVTITKEYVHKGSRIYVEGKIQTREYETSDGIKRYATEVILARYNSSLILLDTKKGTTENSGPNTDTDPNIKSDAQDDNYDNNEIPF